MTKSILVIEDDTLLNQLIVRQIRELGHDVSGVTNWAQAEAYLSGHEP